MLAFQRALYRAIPYGIKGTEGLEQLAEHLLGVHVQGRTEEDQERIKGMLRFFIAKESEGGNGEGGIDEGWEEECITALFQKMIAGGHLHDFDLPLARLWLKNSAQAILNGIMMKENVLAYEGDAPQPAAPWPPVTKEPLDPRRAHGGNQQAGENFHPLKYGRKRTAETDLPDGQRLEDSLEDAPLPSQWSEGGQDEPFTPARASTPTSHGGKRAKGRTG